LKSNMTVCLPGVSAAWPSQRKRSKSKKLYTKTGFCSGVALINDGLRHPIYYSIAEDTGMIGMDWGVNFCVVGLDRNWAYEPHCRAAKP
jgi:hypothetical protein